MSGRVAASVFEEYLTRLRGASSLDEAVSVACDVVEGTLELLLAVQVSASVLERVFIHFSVTHLLA